ncbi:MAG: PTS lactose/cellobiose transporter subunit IIA [Sporolactobacillus sp.]
MNEFQESSNDGNVEESVQFAMQLIANGGNARSSALEAIDLCKAGNFTGADDKLKESDESLKIAHNIQTQMLTNEARGNRIQINLLVIHSQDHLMNAITIRDIAGQFVDLYKLFNKNTE